MSDIRCGVCQDRPCIHDGPKPPQEEEDPRVTIARDVLAQLDARRLVASPGMYLEAFHPDGMKVHASDWSGLEADTYVRDPDVQWVLRGKTCEVCAIGALFVAKVDRVDDLPFSRMHGTLNSDEAMRDYLETDFPPLQLALLELAFEGAWILEQLGETDPDVTARDIWDTCEYHDDSYACLKCEACELRPPFAAALAFYRRYIGRDGEPAERRLRAIMANIIENGGDFRP